jgi:hypothetical protein
MLSSSSSSLASSSSSLSQQPEDITLSLINLKTQINTLQARYDALLSQLDAHVRDGILPITDGESFIANGYRFSHCTRRSYTLPSDHPITLKEKALKAERELAIALGEATEKITHYWTLKPSKP